MTPNTQDQDAWIHRSANMLCQTCMYYVPKAKPSGGPSGIGRCRRHAPTMKGFPAVWGAKDWCGEHKLDEEKLSQSA